MQIAGDPSHRVSRSRHRAIYGTLCAGWLIAVICTRARWIRPRSRSWREIENHHVDLCFLRKLDPTTDDRWKNSKFHLPCESWDETRVRSHCQCWVNLVFVRLLLKKNEKRNLRNFQWILPVFNRYFYVSRSQLSNWDFSKVRKIVHPVTLWFF